MLSVRCWFWADSLGNFILGQKIGSPSCCLCEKSQPKSKDIPLWTVRSQRVDDNAVCREDKPILMFWDCKAGRNFVHVSSTFHKFGSEGGSIAQRGRDRWDGQSWSIWTEAESGEQWSVWNCSKITAEDRDWGIWDHRIPKTEIECPKALNEMTLVSAVFIF